MQPALLTEDVYRDGVLEMCLQCISYQSYKTQQEKLALLRQRDEIAKKHYHRSYNKALRELEEFKVQQNELE